MKIGVIGAGTISEIYLTNMIQRFENLEVKAIADINLDAAKEKAEKHGIQACSVDSLLSDAEIEMVVVLTPVQTHYALIKQALESGKHVYTEKTITLKKEEAQELVTLANQKQLMLGSAPDTFLGAAWQTAREIIDQGTIGEIQSFVLSGNRNNDLLLSLFSFLRVPGCGVLLDYAVYYITCLCALLGPVKDVMATCRNPYPEHINILPTSPEFMQTIKNENESQVNAIIQLENGITGTFNMNSDTVMADQHFFAIYGTKGILYLTDPNDFGGEVQLLMNSMDPRIRNTPKTVHNYFSYGDNSRGIGPSDLAEAITSNHNNRASKEMASHVLEVLHSILESSQNNGAKVSIQSTMERPLPRNRENVCIKKLAHASFNMKNEEAMLHFYRDVLGMKQKFTLTLEKVAAQFEKPGINPDTFNDEQRRIYHWAKSAGSRPWLTYLELSDTQFIELFYDLGNNPREIEDRRSIYGYTKLNFEVDDVLKIKELLLENGYELKEDYHPTVDGSFEISVFDPDGNEVQFTQYGEHGVLKHTEEPSHKQLSNVHYITQIAFDVQDTINTPAFYEKGLGLKKVHTLTVGDLANAMEASGRGNPEQVQRMKMAKNRPWIDYYEIGPHQYIELFYSLTGDLKEDRNLQDSYGYQHICIEVEDIEQARKAVIENGIQPDTETRLGVDGAKQFWLTDPDGNRIELMQYLPDSKQLQE